MQETFSIRPASEDDLPVLADIEARLQKGPWSEANFRGEFDKSYSHILVLSDDETDSKIAGYIAFWLMFDQCEILNIVIDLPYRGLGFAQKLIRKAIDRAVQKGLKKAVLDVRKSNKSALQLYQKMGFTITSVRKAFYTDGEDAYQMSLPLEGAPLEF